MTTVKEVMSVVPYTVRRGDPIGNIRDDMLDNGYHCFPVVDDYRQPVGIITSWDLVDDCAPHESVESRMTADVRTIGPDQPVSEAAALMHKAYVHHLVVVDSANEVIGILSSLDLVSLLIPD